MPWPEFLLILGVCASCTLLARILPVALFADRSLPPRVLAALRYIPVAAFTALVVNDLFDPARLAQGWVANVLPLVALVPVAVVSLKARSLWLSIVVGCGSYALFSWLASLLCGALQ
ncbi:MAG: AzlD domain-containing protein [Coriobacteriales bacterium]|jgi:branched-subunit amino acid transport protein|nr:AzlD domain-containing protein [Coriobacteriales bacterium]